MNINEITLNFNPESLKFLSFILALIIFGISLDLNIGDFRRVLSKPKSVIVGLFAQFILLPMIATGVIFMLEPTASIALGVILLASSPGGNLSNLFTHLSGGDTALSVSMSAVSTMASVIVTPLNFSLWGGLYAPAAKVLKTVHIKPLNMMLAIFFVLILPTIIGVFVNGKYPRVAKKIKPIIKNFGLVFFVSFIFIAFYMNRDHFIPYLKLVFPIVLIINSAGLLLGYQFAKLWGLSKSEARACSFEVGIQNSGFTLLMVYTFFDGLGGMALVAAWWGIWHVVTGLSLTYIWSRKNSQESKLVQ